MAHSMDANPATATPTRDFNRIITVTLGALVTGLFGLMALVMLNNGHLKPFTYKFYYFGLVIALGTGALLCGMRRRFRTAYFLLCFVLLDVSFALLTQMLSKKGMGRSYMPENVVSSRHMYHPLLQAVPRPRFVDRYVVHDEHGYRRTNPIDAGKKSIFAIGGSTTYDLGVKTGHTWTERLESLLNGKVNVVNFGVPGYSTVEHVVQTAFYLDRDKYNIVCALYYVGWNDLRNSFLRDLDPAYADFHLISQTDNLDARRRSVLNNFAIGSLLNRLIHLGFDTVPPTPRIRTDWKDSGVDPRVLKLYLRNVANIVALNREAGITPIFIGQILNFTQFKADTGYGWLPMVKDSAVEPMQRAFNAALVQAGREQGFTVIDLDPTQFGEPDFYDNGHFSSSGSSKFARLISATVRARCAS